MRDVLALKAKNHWFAFLQGDLVGGKSESLGGYLDHARSFRTYLVGNDDSEERNHQQRGQNYFQSFGSHFRFLLSFSSKVKGFSKSD